jgi:hypothetical protein
MTRLEHIAELAGDVRDCAGRLKDLGFPVFAEDLYHAANEAERLARRDSLPPTLAGNAEARATASKHFQKARELLRGIK